MDDITTQGENKVYVALGNDLQEGIKTLEWTLKKWNSETISIIIIHLSYISNDFVYTPFGKLPASSVSEEKIESLNKDEKERIDKLLSKYISFCGQVKSELLKVEKCDDPIHKAMIDIISGHGITKLVMGFSFFKSSSWKGKNAISGSFYIHNNKPDLCELFIICGGKQFSIRGDRNHKAIMEDDHGLLVAKLREKGGFKYNWLGKIFAPNLPNYSLDANLRRITNLDSPSSQNGRWKNLAQEIERYLQHLLSLNLDEQQHYVHDVHKLHNEDFQPSPRMDLSDLTPAKKVEYLERRLKEAQKIIQSNRFEAKENAAKRAKAERAIWVCNQRAEELQAKIKEEVKIRTELTKDIESEKEHLKETLLEIDESRKRLISLKELKTELSNKLQISITANHNSEAQLEAATKTHLPVIREIEELRKQRDVFRRRIEFCREKDAIGVSAKFSERRFGFRELSAEQIRLATNGFAERLRLKSGGKWTMLYKGRINHSIVAIKMIDSANGHSQEDFQATVQLLSQIRHPHLVSMLGFCSTLKCIVFEYMHNGSLRDVFLRDALYARKSSGKRIRTLRWHDRVRVAAQICSALGFLHKAKPKPIVHGNLRLSNILLDRNLQAKIIGFGLSRSPDEQGIRSDIRGLGVFLMHLLTGRNWAGLVEAMSMDRSALVRDLDQMAGNWPSGIAERLADLALTCLSSNRGPNRDLRLDVVMKELSDLRDKALDLVVDMRSDVANVRGFDDEDNEDVPSCFLCPIFTEVMKNPHVASDGFSYEKEAIEEWLRMGNETSPMTNLRLKHSFITPNHTLRTLIQDWHNKRSISLPQ